MKDFIKKMIRFATYKFSGSEKLPGICKGSTHNLAVKKLNFFERIAGNYPTNWKIIAFKPFEHGSPIIHYKSQEEFDKNWEKVNKSTANQGEKVLIRAH